MGFVTPLLLAGAALVAVPIVLHLIMRREAQRLVFPALRFVEQRRSLNQHRLRLRHLVLLVLRCAIIALLALGLARPMLRGSGAAGMEDAPVATALVFDNSLRMEYQQENRSRLEHAQELAGWLLEQLPAEAPVTVVDRAGRQRGQDLDRTAAELRVERLELSPSVRSMADALRDALVWLEERPDHRGEIYVFSDMAAEAWPESALADVVGRLDTLPGANLYVIDVGAREPRNVGLGALRLSSERLAPGGMLQLETELLATGAVEADEEAVVELYVAGEGEPEKRGQQVVRLSAGQPTPVEFSLSGLPLGTHQGFVRLATSDALPSDDVRHFTVEVRPPSKLLLLGRRAADTLFLREALAPSAAAGLAPPRFACEVRRYDQWRGVQFADYRAVCLVDPPPLPDETWQALVDFAEGGGGVGIFLGRQARRDDMNRPPAQQLLPARLRWQSREATYLRPVAVEHPALGELRGLIDIAPWSEFPVFRYWELAAGEEPAHVVASFANGKPALVERPLGAGRVLMLTTSVSDPAHDDPWNLLPTGPDPWPFLVLANGLAEYLSGGGQERLNYLAGQTVVVPLSPDEQLPSYMLSQPDGSAVRQPITPGQNELTIASTEAIGNYRVRAGGMQQRLDRGFSVNLPAELSLLERTSEAQLAAALGEQRTRFARTREEIEVRVGLARRGRELFPLFILAVALFLAAEQWLANRFYEGPTAAGARRSAGQLAAASRPAPEARHRPPAGPEAPAPPRQATADGRQPTAIS